MSIRAGFGIRMAGVGLISAPGTDGSAANCGGAGGGIVILATQGDLNLSGTIDVHGGNAAENSTCSGSGGGGGLIHLLGPNAGSIVCSSSSCNIDGGSGIPASTPRAGGGASAGDGGTSKVTAIGNTVSTGASAGAIFLTTVVDPATLFN